MNEALLAKAAEAKVLRTNRVRADTTVVPANVSYPTDSGLLAKAIRRISTTGQRITTPAVRSGRNCGTRLRACRQQGARHRRETAVPRPAGPGPGQGRRTADHR